MDFIDAHTFGNNQVSQVASLKMIEIIEQDDILENVRKVSAYLEENLNNLKKQFPQIGDVRVLGFHIGIDLVKDPETREPDFSGCSEMREKGFENGIIFGVGGSGLGKNVLKIKPPLITTKEQADEIIEKFELTLRQVYE